MIERFRNWRCWLSNHRKLAESSLSEVAAENRFSDPSSSNATVESLTRADLFKMLTQTFEKLGATCKMNRKSKLVSMLPVREIVELKLSFSIIVSSSSSFSLATIERMKE